MTNQTTGESDVVLLTDKEGNNYLVSRESIEHARVPGEIESEIREFVEADTKGYGNADYLMSGITKTWGLKLGQAGFDQNFDLDGNGVIGAGDWQIAKKAWYEQHSKPPVPSASSGVAGKASVD